MPVNPSVWNEDGTLDVPATNGLGTYGEIPSETLDFTQDLCDLNPPLHVQSVRWRLSELKTEVPSWPEAQLLLIRELKLRWATIQLPPTAIDEDLRHVMSWLSSEVDRKAIDSSAPDAAKRLSTAILRANRENWADFEHRRILSYLRGLDAGVGARTEAALPGCREVPLRLDRRLEPTATIGLEPSNLRLVYREYRNGEVEHVADVVPVQFIVERFRADGDDDWFRWSQEDGRRFQARREELIDEIRTKFHPSTSMVRGLAVWLEALPRGATISTRLALRGPRNDAGVPVGWWVPPVFSRQAEGRTDAAGILAGWYRPRSREVAMRRLEELLDFLTTDKLRAILCYVVGTPIVARLAPYRPLPYLELVGESRVGKTKTAQASIAVAWGIGDGYREYLGGDAVKSNFRRLDFGSSTDFPLLVDESSLNKNDREHLRSQANGATSTRGGTDLMHKAYAATAPLIFTCNASPDDSESSASEQHGDDRRRIRLFFDSTDLDAVSDRREAFERWLRVLPGEEVVQEEKGVDMTASLNGGWSEDGGGAALWKLNDFTRREDGEARLRETIEGAPNEQQLVLDVGALVLGIPRVVIAQERVDHAAESLLEWVRVETGLWFEAQKRTRMDYLHREDPIAQRIRVVDKDGETADLAQDAYAVYFTASELEEYKAHRRRLGSSSPYHRLSDLSTLAAVTNQTPGDLLGQVERGRATARGHLVRVNGSAVRAVKLLLPKAGSSDGVDNKLPEEAAPGSFA